MIAELEERPEADRAEGAPHPRFATSLVGQEIAERGFLGAFNMGRLHHAWLLTGPAGIGKATLAWRIARFLLSRNPAGSGGMFDDPDTAPGSLDVAPQSALAHRLQALSEPGLSLLRRPWEEKTKKLKAVITVEEVRLLKRRFTLSLPDGGRRVVIVDSADEMNTSSANALLKLLEEPPANTVFLLISHMPSRLLPTIRSRCRTLACAPLGVDDLSEVLVGLDPSLTDDAARTLAGLAAGSVGRAVQLHLLDGAALRRDIDRLFATMPGVDRGKALALATALSARDADERRELFLQLIDEALGELARDGARGGGTTPRLSPGLAAARLWAEAQQEVTARVRQGLAVNLDAHSLILDMVLRIDATAAQCAAS